MIIPPTPTFDPLLLLSVILIQVGARHLDLELTEFQEKLLKNKIVQAVILFGLIYLDLISYLNFWIDLIFLCFHIDICIKYFCGCLASAGVKAVEE